jgi:hypothetical protein
MQPQDLMQAVFPHDRVSPSTVRSSEVYEHGHGVSSELSRYAVKNFLDNIQLVHK